MPSAFEQLPIIDLALAESPETRYRCYEQLRYALFNVGFMYVKNHGIPEVSIFMESIRSW